MDDYNKLIADGEAIREAEDGTPPTFSKKQVKKRPLSNKAYLGCAIVFFFVMFSLLNSGTTDAEKLDKAEALKIEAMQESCNRWNDRHTGCYGRGKSEEACKQYQESTVWFTNAYGEIPEIACAASTIEYSFLGLASR